METWQQENINYLRKYGKNDPTDALYVGSPCRSSMSDILPMSWGKKRIRTYVFSRGTLLFCAGFVTGCLMTTLTRSKIRRRGNGFLISKKD